MTVEMTRFVPPPGLESIPDYDDGWLLDGVSAPYLTYLESSRVNWSDRLERLHEEASRTHFLDVWTRAAIVACLGNVDPRAVILDLGCSSGYMLEDLHSAHPEARLVGVDLVAAGLPRAHAATPTARLLQADVCDLPMRAATVDAIVSANLLEHVPDDRAALMEILRVLRPGATAVIVVPAGPGTFDYYDRFLGHERRYARHELANRGRSVGLEVFEDRYIGSLLYPAFWLVKQRNRRRYAELTGVDLENRVVRDIASTRTSHVGGLLRRLEEVTRMRLPFGIRNLVGFRRPA